MSEDPIFILGAHKSGTSLVRNLLDDHKELSVIPFESHFLELLGFWIENPTRTNVPEELTNEEFVERAVEFAGRFNKKDNPYGDVVLSQKMNITKLKNILEEKENLDSEEARIQAYLEGIQVSLDHQRGKRIVEKSVENFEYAVYLSKLFPKARFIHILRNPYSNVVALRKFKQKGMKAYPRLDTVLETVRLSYYYAEKNKKVIDNYKVIKYEDLLESPEDLMKELSAFLKIGFSDTLLEPTSQGKKWFGNSTTDERKKGVSAKGIDAWKKSIKPMEVEAVNRKMAYALSIYGYAKLKRSGTIWARYKKESLSKYLNNRIYLFQ